MMREGGMGSSCHMERRETRVPETEKGTGAVVRQGREDGGWQQI